MVLTKWWMKESLGWDKELIVLYTVFSKNFSKVLPSFVFPVWDLYISWVPYILTHLYHDLQICHNHVVVAQQRTTCKDGDLILSWEWIKSKFNRAVVNSRVLLHGTGCQFLWSNFDMFAPLPSDIFNLAPFYLWQEMTRARYSVFSPCIIHYLSNIVYRFSHYYNISSQPPLSISN